MIDLLFTFQMRTLKEKKLKKENVLKHNQINGKRILENKKGTVGNPTLQRQERETWESHLKIIYVIVKINAQKKLVFRIDKNSMICFTKMGILKLKMRL